MCHCSWRYALVASALPAPDIQSGTNSLGATGVGDSIPSLERLRIAGCRCLLKPWSPDRQVEYYLQVWIRPCTSANGLDDAHSATSFERRVLRRGDTLGLALDFVGDLGGPRGGRTPRSELLAT